MPQKKDSEDEFLNENEDIYEEDQDEEVHLHISKKDAFLEKLRARNVQKKHKGIERKTRNFAIAVLILVTGSGYSVYHNHVVTVEATKQETPPGMNVKFSLSGTGFQTGGAIRSSDLRTVYVPIQFSDINSLSTDANNYFIFVGSPNEKITYQPHAQLLIFGDTGRAVLVVQGQPKINNEMLTIYIRNDKNLTGSQQADIKTDGLFKDKGMTAVLKTYDIAQFNINPGATNIRSVTGLDSTSLNANTLYRKLFSDSQVNVIHKEIEEKLRAIELDIERLKEYRSRLERAGYSVPSDPIYMQKNWRSASSENVKLSNSLDEGFADTGGLDSIISKVEKMKQERMKELETSQKNNVDTEQDTNILNNENVSVDNEITIDDNELFELDKVELPSHLIRDDGTFTDSKENATESGISAQSTWDSMKTIYENTLKTKQTLYTTTARELLKIEKESNRQQKNASLSNSDKFSLITPVEIENK